MMRALFVIFLVLTAIATAKVICFTQVQGVPYTTTDTGRTVYVYTNWFLMSPPQTWGPYQLNGSLPQALFDNQFTIVWQPKQIYCITGFVSTPSGFSFTTVTEFSAGGYTWYCDESTASSTYDVTVEPPAVFVFSSLGTLYPYAVQVSYLPTLGYSYGPARSIILPVPATLQNSSCVAYGWLPDNASAYIYGFLPMTGYEPVESGYEPNVDNTASTWYPLIWLYSCYPVYLGGPNLVTSSTTLTFQLPAIGTCYGSWYIVSLPRLWPQPALVYGLELPNGTVYKAYPPPLPPFWNNYSDVYVAAIFKLPWQLQNTIGTISVAGNSIINPSNTPWTNSSMWGIYVFYNSTTILNPIYNIANQPVLMPNAGYATIGTAGLLSNVLAFAGWQTNNLYDFVPLQPFFNQGQIYVSAYYVTNATNAVVAFTNASFEYTSGYRVMTGYGASFALPVVYPPSKNYIAIIGATDQNGYDLMAYVDLRTIPTASGAIPIIPVEPVPAYSMSTVKVVNDFSQPAVFVFEQSLTSPYVEYARTVIYGIIGVEPNTTIYVPAIPSTTVCAYNVSEPLIWSNYSLFVYWLDDSSSTGICTSVGSTIVYTGSSIYTTSSPPTTANTEGSPNAVQNAFQAIAQASQSQVYISSSMQIVVSKQVLGVAGSSAPIAKVPTFSFSAAGPAIFIAFIVAVAIAVALSRDNTADAAIAAGVAIAVMAPIAAALFNAYPVAMGLGALALALIATGFALRQT